MHRFAAGDYVLVKDPDFAFYGKIVRMNKVTAKVRRLQNEEENNYPTENLTYLPPFVFDEENRRRLIRLEEPYSRLTRNMPVAENVCITGEKHPVTCEDLLAGLENAKKYALSAASLAEEWILPVINWLEDGYGFHSDSGEDAELPGLIPPGAAPLFFWLSILNDVRLGHIDYDEYAGQLRTYLNERDVPLRERTFTDLEMETFIHFHRERGGNGVGDAEKALYVRFTETLAAKDNVFALEARAYGEYGGDEFYGCDWAAAERDLLKLFALTDDGQYANSLGYIYYYGRTTGGAPQYEKAFQYFAVGDAQGLMESAVKLSDLFYYGNGTVRSVKTALVLLRNVFRQSLEDVTAHKYGTNLADSARRLAQACAEGHVTDDSELFSERSYLLLALRGIGLRMAMANRPQYGDESVLAKILTQAAKAGVVLNPVPTRSVPCNPIDLLRLNAGLGVKMEAHLRGGRLVIRTPETNAEDGERSMLILLPEAGVCTLADKITLGGAHFVCDTVSREAEVAPFDSVEVRDNIVFLLRDGVPQVYFTAEKYTVRIEEPVPKDEAPVRDAEE